MLRLCTLLALLCRVVTEHEPRHLFESQDVDTSSMYLWDKVQFGKRWQVYIQVMTFDILHTCFYQHESSKYMMPETLLDSIRNLPIISKDKHPCRMGFSVMRGRQFHGKFFVQHTRNFDHFMSVVFRICGLFRFTYHPSHYIDESEVLPGDVRDMQQIYPGIPKSKYTMLDMQAGEGFRINCTVSDFTAPRSHGCADVRITVERSYPQGYYWYVICPNWGKHNFVAEHVVVHFFMAYYQTPLITHTGDQHFTNLSIHYQILDVSNMLFKLYMFPMFPTRQRAELGMEYLLGVYHFNSDTFLTLSNSSLIYVVKFPQTLVYAFTLYTDDFLTPVMSRPNFTCNIPGAEAIFYDGPVQAFWQPVLPLLKHWSCSKMLDNTTGDSEEDTVRGSLGELNIIFLVPTEMQHDFSEVNIVWRAERMMSDVLRIHEIVLDNSTAERTIHFHPARSTSLDVVHLQAPAGKFLHLAFTELSYLLHSEMYSSRFFRHCLDGLEIQEPARIHVSGQICSNSTAENLLNHYRMDGLTVGQEVTLKRKQYVWLATISAVITASAQNCAGYINLFHTKDLLFRHHTAPWAMVLFTADMRYIENGNFVGFSNFGVIFKRSHKACCKLQIVPFNELIFYELELSRLKHMHRFLRYTIISEDLTTPGRFIIDFSSIGETLQFENTSSLYGIRMASLNNRFVKHASTYTTVWDTAAYSAEIGLHSSSLTHAAGFIVQVDDGNAQPVCTYEQATNVTALAHHLNLIGPCAYAEWNYYAVTQVTIHKLYDTKGCCHYAGHITTHHSVNANIILHLIVESNGEPWIGNTFDLSGSNTVITFQMLCTHLCLGIAIGSNLNRISGTLSIAYYAHLVDASYPTDITFPKVNSRYPNLLWNKVCYDYNCYITPRGHMATTWEEAQTACEQQGATLVSISSDLEWALLTRLPQLEGEEFIELYNIRSFVTFYIGLATEVSTSML